jgi:hypothetical protein
MRISQFRHARFEPNGQNWKTIVVVAASDLFPADQGEACCPFSCRLNPALSGIPKGEQRQITLSVNDLQVSCRTS